MEILISLAVLGIGLPAIAMIFSVAIGEDVEVSKETKARYLADSLMSEISQRRFRESTTQKGNSVDTGETNGWVRSAFDDVDDYQIFADTWSNAVNPPRNEAGNVITGFEEFTQKVNIYNVAAPTMTSRPRALTAVSAGTTDFKMVIVTISWDSGRRSVATEKLFALSLPEDQ